jgi:hypothetical protein
MAPPCRGPSPAGRPPLAPLERWEPLDRDPAARNRR